MLISRLKEELPCRQVGARQIRPGEVVVVDHCRPAVAAGCFHPSLASALLPHLIEFLVFL
jgi:hypothetical protein